MQKEHYWSQFATDFESRNRYVVGDADMQISLAHLAQYTQLGNVLELGCGNGTYSKILAANATQLIATDLSEEMLQVAQQQLKNQPNIKIECADCAALPYAPHQFDTVFMANLLHVIANPQQTLQQCAKVLKPNGKIMILSFTVEDMAEPDIQAMLLRYQQSYGEKSATAYMLTQALCTTMLRDAGFDQINITTIGKQTRAIFALGCKI